VKVNPEAIAELCAVADDGNLLKLEPILPQLDPLVAVGVERLMNGSSLEEAIAAMHRIADAQVASVRFRAAVAAETLDLLNQGARPGAVARRLGPFILARDAGISQESRTGTPKHSGDRSRRRGERMIRQSEY
jgi:hypothetical protein